MKKIEIIVSPKGESKIETTGFTGSECRETSKFVEGALGKTVGEELKPEFHETALAENSVENSNET